MRAVQRRQRQNAVLLAVLGISIAPWIPTNRAEAARRVAIIDDGFFGELWCGFLIDNGFECRQFPLSGPTESLASFDVVINPSPDWTDPQELLAAHMRAGNGVIVWGAAPKALGIDDDPTVQAWMGANAWSGGSGALRTTTTDPILGNRPVGSLITDCSDSVCQALDDVSGHPNAIVLATFDIPGTIGIMRNAWEGGRSVYFTQFIDPQTTFHQDIILRSVNVVGPPIPTVSHWGLAVMTLLLLSAGSVVLHRHRSSQGTPTT